MVYACLYLPDFFQSWRAKLKEVKIKLPRGQVKIELRREFADRLDPIARSLGRQFNLYGLRARARIIFSIIGLRIMKEGKAEVM